MSAVAGFIQSAMLPMVVFEDIEEARAEDHENTNEEPKEESEEELAKLVKTWMSYDYVEDTKHIRKHFWEHPADFTKGQPDDCQTIYHRLTHKGPLYNLMAFDYMEGKTTKAFTFIRKNDDPPISALFNHTDYLNPNLLYLPKFITINDTIASANIEDQYHYPDLFVIKEGNVDCTYQLHGRVMAMDT
ncbi:unnamed protein product [Absidia cylindrospora]